MNCQKMDVSRNIIDWLRFEISNATLDKVLEIFGIDRIDYYKFKPSHFNDYGHSIRYKKGFSIHFDKWPGPNKEIIDCSGSFLALIGDDLTSKLLNCLYKGKSRALRIDYAIDDMVGLVSMPTLVKKARAFQVDTTVKKVNILETVDYVENSIASTIYFGSRQSSKMLRIYDKKKAEKRINQAADENIAENRIELETKNTYSDKLFYTIYDGELIDWSIVKHEIENMVMFKNRKGYRFREWVELLGIEDIEKKPIRVGKKRTDLEKKKQWLEKQVAGTLSEVVKIEGQDYVKYLLSLKLSGKEMEKHSI